MLKKVGSNQLISLQFTTLSLSPISHFYQRTLFVFLSSTSRSISMDSTLNISLELDSSFYDHTAPHTDSQNSIRGSGVKRKCSATDYWKRFICLGSEQRGHCSPLSRENTALVSGDGKLRRGESRPTKGIVQHRERRCWLSKLRRGSCSERISGVSVIDDSSLINTGASISHARRVKICTQLKRFNSRKLHDLGTV